MEEVKRREEELRSHEGKIKQHLLDSLVGGGGGGSGGETLDDPFASASSTSASSTHPPPRPPPSSASSSCFCCACCSIGSVPRKGMAALVVGSQRHPVAMVMVGRLRPAVGGRR
jgi:hypothetical protein